MGWHSLFSECAVGQRFRDLNLIKSKTNFLLANVQSSSGVQPASSSKGLGFILVVKQLAHDVEPSTPGSMEAKNEWRFTSTPCCMPHGMGRDSVPFHLYCLWFK